MHSQTASLLAHRLPTCLLISALLPRLTSPHLSSTRPSLQYERALKVFEEARSLGVPLDARAFNLALRACHTPGKTLRHEQLMQVRVDGGDRSGVAG